MRVSPGVMTFLVGLVVLAVAGVLYQQALIANGQASPGKSTAPVAAGNVKYMCPMRCVEMDEPGQCPVCGMDMTPVELAAPAGLELTELYTCPMHPQIEQDHPGTCPICGMELVPKADDAGAVDPATQESVAAVKLSPLQAVLADVQAVHPSYEQLAVEIKAIGEVRLPENQVNSLVSWQAGRIDNLVLRDTGGTVAQGDHILDIYSAELVQAQDEYLLALSAAQNLGDSAYASIAESSQKLLEAARSKLLRLGLTAKQLTDLETARVISEHVPIYAGHGGIVMEKHVNEGEYVKEGARLFEVASLDNVWVELAVFEADMAQLQLGDRVVLLCPIHPGMTFHGTIDLIEPLLTVSTRTHRVRVNVANRDLILRPGMIVDAQLTVDYGEMLLLPRNAILHTGDGDLVYVLAGENLWEPRAVVIGNDFGDRVEIRSGLSATEAVAGTAVFLIDSEAQLKGVPRPVDEPVAAEQPQTEDGTHAGHGH
ncbi:efflux RND transporter periplasmic adaptor subunit [bacterium]|nr:efflux RND transporter periplasmic adaptor subunit [bacterium]